MAIASDETLEAAAREIDTLLERELVLAQVAPGGVAGTARWQNGRWYWAVGRAGVSDPFDGEPVSAHTWYDLASLTKSVTALTVARAVAIGDLDWDAPLGRYLPWLDGTFGAEASLRSALSHRAGFVAHARLRDASVSELRRVAEAKRPDLDPRAVSNPLEPYPALYSDVGYILIGKLLEQVFERRGLALDDAFVQELQCLGDGCHPGWATEIASSRQLLKRELPVGEVAPTELVPYRSGLVRGQVHDDNAWLLSETRTSGHAGLFGTARGVLGLGTTLLDWVSGRTVGLDARSREVLLGERADSSLRAGFDTKNRRGPSTAGSVLGHRTFGHLGFTGTSYWCDPDAETVVVLLSNRVCPSRDNPLIREARPKIHDGLARLALTLGGE